MAFASMQLAIKSTPQYESQHIYNIYWQLNSGQIKQNPKWSVHFHVWRCGKWFSHVQRETNTDCSPENVLHAWEHRFAFGATWSSVLKTEIVIGSHAVGKEIKFCNFQCSCIRWQRYVSRAASTSAKFEIKLDWKIRIEIEFECFVSPTTKQPKWIYSALRHNIINWRFRQHLGRRIAPWNVTPQHLKQNLFHSQVDKSTDSALRISSSVARLCWI